MCEKSTDYESRVSLSQLLGTGYVLLMFLSMIMLLTMTTTINTAVIFIITVIILLR